MWYNGMMRWLLRSPFHRLLSGNVLLLTYSGRKTGRIYTTPVNYVRDGEVFSVTSSRDRTWWRNLRGGAPVTVRWRGQALPGVGEVCEDDEGVAAGLMVHLREAPRLARYFGVRLDPDGRPNAEDVARAARGRVIVRLRVTR